ncbi:MAG: tyrosine-type recombinase/integrase [Actinomycetes bacterium]
MAPPRRLCRATVGEVVAAYAEWLHRQQAVGRLSPGTVATYLRDLDELCAIVGTGTVLDDLEPDDVERALLQVAQARDRRFTRSRKVGVAGRPATGRGLHSRTRWLVSVRGLFRWAARRGYVQVDPTLEVAPPRPPRRAAGARLGLTEDAAAALRDAPGSSPPAPPRRDQRLALRDEVVLRLLVETGPRVAEICAANRDDLFTEADTGVPMLHIRHGKGGVPRDIPLSAACRAAWERYDAEERAAPPAGDPAEVRRDAARALIVSVRGRRLHPRDVQRLVRRAVGRMPVELRRQVTPHGLRHTAATVLLRAGNDVGTVAHILGHGSVATTSVYLDPSSRAAADALARSPLAY